MSNDPYSYQLTIEPRRIINTNLADSHAEESFKILIADHHISQVETKNCYAIAIVTIDNFEKRTEKLPAKDQTAILNEFMHRISTELAPLDTFVSSTTGQCYILFKEIDCMKKPEAKMYKIRNAMVPYFNTSTGFIKIVINLGLAISQPATILPTEILENALTTVSSKRSTQHSLFISTKGY